MPEFESNIFLKRNVYSVLGLPFDAVTLDETKDWIFQCVDENKPCFLSTPNLNFAMSAMTDDRFYESVVKSDLCIADGMPIIWIARLLGIPLKERVAGSDLFEAIVNDKNRKMPIKIFFFGGEAGAAEKAHSRLNETGVGAISCGFYDPGFVSVDAMSSPDIIETINQCEPDFILVALGAKKGQSWILKNRDSLNAPVISHLGAVINFVSDRVRRSPGALQKLGLEWVWRIYQEPGLWKRYYFDGVSLLKYALFGLMPLLFSKNASYYLKKGEGVPDFVVKDDGIIHISGVITDRSVSDFKKELVKLLYSTNQRELTLDCNKLKYICNSAIATLQLFGALSESKNKKIRLKGLSRSIKNTLKRSLVSSRFYFLM